MDAVTRAIVTGTSSYAVDGELPGMLHARILRSHYAHARIISVDTSEVPDDVVVLTPDDVRELAPYGCQIADERVLAVDVARYVGDPVAAIAAATAAQAAEAIELIRVDYEELPAVFDAVEAAGEAAPLVHDTHEVSANPAAYFGIRPQPGTNVCHLFSIRSGDVDRGFARGGLSSSRARSGRRLPITPRWSHTLRSPSGTVTGSRCGAVPRLRSTCGRTSRRSSGSRWITSGWSSRRWEDRSARRRSFVSRRSWLRSRARRVVR